MLKTAKTISRSMRGELAAGELTDQRLGGLLRWCCGSCMIPTGNSACAACADSLRRESRLKRRSRCRQRRSTASLCMTDRVHAAGRRYAGMLIAHSAPLASRCAHFAVCSRSNIQRRQCAMAGAMPHCAA